MTTTERLRGQMKHPDNVRRPVQIIHSYYPKTAADTAAYLDAAQKNGLGGFVVNMDVSLPRLPEESDEAYRFRSLDVYLGEETPETDAEWEHLRNFIDACFARGLEVWIYDERAYPSGAAGNKVLCGHPEDQVKGLFCRTVLTGAGKGRINADSAGTFRFAAAYPLTPDGQVDTSVRYDVQREGDEICWNLPDTHERYRVCAFCTRAVGFYTENRVPYPDLLRADVTDRFLEVTHEAYLRHLGAERIAGITAFFTDEPGLPTHGCSSYFYETDAVAAWTEAMDELLPADMPEHYADLFFDTTGDFAAYRRRWWQCAAELFAEHYFGRIAAWCEVHGTRMTGHLYGEETLSMQIGLNADLFGLIRRMQMPGVDRLYTFDPRDVTAEKTASSAAHLCGHPWVMSESSFHLEYNWWKIPQEATHRNRMNSTYYQLQLGVSHIASYYPYSAAPDPERLAFEEETARASMFCGTGTHCTDVLVLIPRNAAYERFAPPDHKYWDVGPCIVAPHQGESIQILERIYGTALEFLENDTFDFDLIDEESLASCAIRDGVIDTGYERFRVLVLFDSAEPEPDTAAWIEHYLKSGGRIAVIETDKPSRFCAKITAQYPEQVHRTIADGLTQTCRLCGASPLLTFTEDCPTVRVRKTVTDDAELWFIHNRGDEITVTVGERGEFAVFTPDGEETSVKSGADGTFRLTLPAMSARMLVRQKTEESDDVQ